MHIHYFGSVGQGFGGPWQRFKEGDDQYNKKES